MSKKKALIVVAHCDDAVLWMGGVISHLIKDWSWHIFSLCNEDNPNKIGSFNKTCQMLSVKKCHPFNFSDYQNGGIFSTNDKEKMLLELKEYLDQNYDYIFTHGMQEWNEYSHHDNHQEAAIIASEIAEEKKSPCIYFCYKPIYPVGVATAANPERAVYYFQLNYEELKFKLKLIDCFSGEKSSLVALGYPCVNPEAFESSNNLPSPPFVKIGRILKHQVPNYF